MGKEKRPFCCHQNFVPNMLSVPAQGYKHVEKHEKTCIKSDLRDWELATNGQSDKGFPLTSTFVPMGLSAPALGLYTCVKALKYILGPCVRWAFTGSLVLWSNFFSWETARMIEAEFHVDHPWDGGTKICSNGPGHMTKVATMPIYGKNMKNSSSL